MDYREYNKFNIKVLEISLPPVLMHINAKKLTYCNNLTFNMYNEGAYKSNMPRNIIQEIHKSNYKVTNRSSDILNKNVTIQRRSVWYFKFINNRGSNTKSRSGTEKDSFLFMYDCSRRYNQHNENQMCPGYFIKSVKWLWWVLFYKYIHQEMNA